MSKMKFNWQLEQKLPQIQFMPAGPSTFQMKVLKYRPRSPLENWKLALKVKSDELNCVVCDAHKKHT